MHSAGQRCNGSARPDMLDGPCRSTLPLQSAGHSLLPAQHGMQTRACGALRYNAHRPVQNALHVPFGSACNAMHHNVPCKRCGTRVRVRTRKHRVCACARMQIRTRAYVSPSLVRGAQCGARTTRALTCSAATAVVALQGDVRTAAAGGVQLSTARRRLLRDVMVDPLHSHTSTAADADSEQHSNASTGEEASGTGGPDAGA